MNNEQVVKKAPTIVKVLITASILALSMIVATPVMDAIVADEQALRILRLLERVDQATRRHHADTKRIALEYAAPNAKHAFAQKRYHHLSMEQLYSDWQGPYLRVPLSQADNPFGGMVELHNNLSDNPALGFSLLTGSRAEEDGQYLVLTQVPENIALKLDAHFDSRSEEPPANWQDHGRVEWTDEDGGTLSLFIFDAN